MVCEAGLLFPGRVRCRTGHVSECGRRVEPSGVGSSYGPPVQGPPTGRGGATYWKVGVEGADVPLSSLTGSRRGRRALVVTDRVISSLPSVPDTRPCPQWTPRTTRDRKLDDENLPVHRVRDTLWSEGEHQSPRTPHTSSTGSPSGRPAVLVRPRHYEAA